MTDRMSADAADLPRLLDALRDTAMRGLAELDERPAAVPPTPVRTIPLPHNGIGAHAALTDFQCHWEARLSGSAGPRYCGFVTGGTTPAALAGDWLTTVYDQNAGVGGDSGAPQLERQTAAWLAELFGLTGHTGVFVTGATMSNLSGLALGRQWLGRQRGVNVAVDGATALGEPTVLSATPHSSVVKAMSVLGMGRSALEYLPTVPGSESVDVAALGERLEQLGDRPVVVVANAGTVNTGDFDDLAGIARLRDRYPFWWHVDAAFGGFAAVSPTTRHLTDGIAAADSVCVDLHKWLNVPYDAAMAFTSHDNLRTEVFGNNAAYLGEPGAEPDFLHLGPENSRRLRALPTWFTLRAYGRDGYRRLVERNIAAARRLGDRLSRSPDARLTAPVRLNVVCFVPTRRSVPEVVDEVARTGTTFVTPTVMAGVPAVRAAFTNWRTDTEDVDAIGDALEAALAAPRP